MLRYSHHARRRMRERGITEDDVEAVVAMPTARWPSEQPGKTVLVGYSGHRSIAVVALTNDFSYIVTAWDRAEA